MQTFILDRSLTRSFNLLDGLRANKQLLEAIQIYQINTNIGILDSFVPKSNPKKQAWYNHPAVEMWRESPGDLSYYIYCCARELKNRGKNSEMIRKAYGFNELNGVGFSSIHPPLWKNDKLISSHRKSLIIKSFAKACCYLASYKHRIELADAAVLLYDINSFFDQYAHEYFPTNLKPEFFCFESLAKEAERFSKNKRIICNVNTYIKELMVFEKYWLAFYPDPEGVFIDLNYYWPTREEKYSND